MKIHIPNKQEKENTNGTVETTEGKTESYITSLNENMNDKENTKSTQNTKVNINTATQAQLETLSGIGPSTATKIIAYRKEKGKFKKIEDIKEVSGIGNSKFEKIKNDIVVK